MKLKKAIKLARKEGCNWVAVDYSGAICAYSSEPERLNTLWDTAEEFEYIGRYTGGKSWEDTLREVNPKVKEVPVPYDITQNEAWDTWTDEWKEKMLKEHPTEESQTDAWVHEIPVDLVKYAEEITLKELNKIRYFVNRMITKEENLLTTGHSPTNGE